MKRTEYSETFTAAPEKHQDMHPDKQEDVAIPEFAKEVPRSAKMKDTSDGTVKEYSWKDSFSSTLRIKSFTYRKSEDLDEVFRLNVADGADTYSFRHNKTTYIVRKTTKEIAQAVYHAYSRIKGVVEDVVGFFKTMLGNDYIITKIDREAWTFDKRVACEGINYVDPETLGRQSRSTLTERIAEKVSELHSVNLIIGRFTLNNLILGEKDVKLTDLRRMRMSRKRAFVIEEYIAILQYLFSIGVASREDVYHSIAYYAGMNEASCMEWYNESSKKKAKDLFEAVTKMEEAVYK